MVHEMIFSLPSFNGDFEVQRAHLNNTMSRPHCSPPKPNGNVFKGNTLGAQESEQVSCFRSMDRIGLKKEICITILERSSFYTQATRL